METKYSSMNLTNKALFLLKKSFLVWLHLGILMFVGVASNEPSWVLLGGFIMLLILPPLVLVEIYLQNHELVFVPSWERISPDILSRLRHALELHNLPTKENRKSTVTEVHARGQLARLRITQRKERIIVSFRGDFYFPFSIWCWYSYTNLAKKYLERNGYVKV